MEELKTLNHDLYKLWQKAKTAYSKDVLDQYIELFQEYEISVDDVSISNESPKTLFLKIMQNIYY